MQNLLPHSQPLKNYQSACSSFPNIKFCGMFVGDSHKKIVRLSHNVPQIPRSCRKYVEWSTSHKHLHPPTNICTKNGLKCLGGLEGSFYAVLSLFIWCINFLVCSLWTDEERQVGRWHWSSRRAFIWGCMELVSILRFWALCFVGHKLLTPWTMQTVEWLLGQSLDNDRQSWSDKWIGELPNIYVYAWKSRNTFLYGCSKSEDGSQMANTQPEVLDLLLKTMDWVIQEIDSVECGMTNIQEHYAKTPGTLKKAAGATRT